MGTKNIFKFYDVIVQVKGKGNCPEKTQRTIRGRSLRVLKAGQEIRGEKMVEENSITFV
jgi:hypothetical protein